MPNEFDIVAKETGEVVDLDAFRALPLDQKAQVFAQVHDYMETLSELYGQMKISMQLALMQGRTDPLKPVRMFARVKGQTVEVYIGGGVKDKRLNETETRAFCQALQDLDPEAYKAVVSMKESVGKAAVNKLRTVPGPVADLCNSYFGSDQPKDLEVKKQ